MNGHRHGPQFVSQQQPQQHSHPASISVTQHRAFLCLIASCCHAKRDVGWCSGAPDGAAEDAEDAHMDGILNNEELEQVFESIGGAEDSGRLERVKREAGELQLATKRRMVGRSKP